jgi:hypothetical protein
MQYKLRALVWLLVVVASCCDAAAARSGSRWWPFGGDNDAPSQPQAEAAGSGMASAGQAAPQGSSAYLPDEEPEPGWMIDSPLAKVSWPRLHLPEMPKPRMPQLWPQKSEVEAARNAWVEHDPQAAQPSALQAVTDGAKRVGASSRAAWDKTVDALTPGESSDHTSSRIARRDERRPQAARPPWWKRMFGAEEPQGPQTITEWMAQERLDP